MPRPSIFRDAMQVSPEVIANLGDDDLNELMRDLFRAQAHRCRSPLSEVRVNTEGKAKDGGCDGWTSKPEVNDDWLGDADTCWQLKARTAGIPSRLKGEILKQIPKKTLRSGGRFVVVANGSKNGKKGERDRKKKLLEDARLCRHSIWIKLELHKGRPLCNVAMLYVTISGIKSRTPCLAKEAIQAGQERTIEDLLKP